MLPEKPSILPAPAEPNASTKLEKTTDDVDAEYLTQEEKFEFGVDINLLPNTCSQEDDASLRLLKESTATNDGNKEVVDADSASVKWLKYQFVGGYQIEKATKVLDLCMGTGTALDEKHSSREEIQLLQLQQVASNGRNTQVTPP